MTSKSITAPSKVGLIAYGSGPPRGPQHIFLVDASGAVVTQLTHEGTANFFPCWSPDGKMLAYTSDAASEGVAPAVAPPDGRPMGFTPPGTPQVWVMDADGNGKTQLTTEGGNAHPAWSPDGQRICFDSDRSGQMEIWVMEADGGNQMQLTHTDVHVEEHEQQVVANELLLFGFDPVNSRGITNLFPSWSPDGRRITFATTRNGLYAVWSMDADGGNLEQLTFPKGEDYPYANIPTWSPKGDRIAFWSGKELGPGFIWSMNTDGSGREKLTAQPRPYNCDEPAWTPDGEHILYATNRPGSGGIGIWIMRADGTNHRVLIRNTHVRGRPAWRPATTGG